MGNCCTPKKDPKPGLVDEAAPLIGEDAKDEVCFAPPMADPARLCSSEYNLGLDRERWQSLFSQSVCLHGGGFVIWRLLLALASMGLTIWSIYDWTIGIDDDGDGTTNFDGTTSYEGAGFGAGYWFTKLTHWGLLTETLYFILAYICACSAVYGVDTANDEEVVEEAPEKQTGTPLLVSIVWTLYSIILPVSLGIVVMYWIFIYKGGPVQNISIATHGGNFLLMLLDFCFCQQPMYVRDLLYVFLFSSTYLVFTIIYYFAGGTYQDGVSRFIYPIIDWDKWKTTTPLAAAIVFIGTPLLWGMCFGMYKARGILLGH
jgi:hypothetical protein